MEALRTWDAPSISIDALFQRLLREHLNKTKISGARGVQPGEVADFSKNGPVFGVYALPS